MKTETKQQADTLRLLICFIITLIGGILLVVSITGCKKEHGEYRFTPKFHIGEQVQFAKGIEHDFNRQLVKYYDTTCNCILEKFALHMSDIPQPFRVDSFKYNDQWRDNWYWVSTRYVKSNGDTIKIKRDTSIDELSLQHWNGRLQK